MRAPLARPWCTRSGRRSCLFVVLLIAAAASGCERRLDLEGEAEAEASAPGTIRTAARIGYYPAVAGRFLLRRTPLGDQLTVAHGVTLYRVEYWTTGPSGEPAPASGLVVYPKGTRPRGVVSYHHATRTSRQDVPSRKSREGLLAAIGFGGHGYLVAAPDYLGLGTSPAPHPYLHTETEANAVIDLLAAARRLTRHLKGTWPDRIFLTGFSQGGHASMAAQRALEAQPRHDLRITAAAPVAGLYDISGLAFPFALEGRSSRSSLYIAYVTTAYSRLYGQPLSSLVTPAWADELPALFDGAVTFDEIVQRLPPDPRALLRPDFLDAREARESHWFLAALKANDVNDWAPAAPVRLYYGTEDDDSPPSDALRAAERFRSLGGCAIAIDVGATDHEETIFAAVPHVVAWFDSLSAQPSTAPPDVAR